MINNPIENLGGMDQIFDIDPVYESSFTFSIKEQGCSSDFTTSEISITGASWPYKLEA
jgi:hypothetical protein